MSKPNIVKLKINDLLANYRRNSQHGGGEGQLVKGLRKLLKEWPKEEEESILTCTDLELALHKLIPDINNLVGDDPEIWVETPSGELLEIVCLEFSPHANQVVITTRESQR